LYSIDNITAANGWAIAAVGATIVFVGLVVLSFAIAQIHKILQFWEDRGTHFVRFRAQTPSTEAQKPDTPAYKEQHLPNAGELAATYGPLVAALEETFDLAQLFVIAKENDLPHPHLSINNLREAGILVAREDGTFSWKKI
jgi:hypothetical protein